MTSALLLPVALAQGAMLLAIGGLLVLRRFTQPYRQRRGASAAVLVRYAMRRWLLGGGVEKLVLALREVPSRLAVDQLLVAAGNRVSPSMVKELAEALRGERWVQRVLGQAESRWWWRRLQAARLLEVVAQPGDTHMLRLLLHDSHPAVRIAATASIALASDPELVRELVETLPDEHETMRLHRGEALRRVWRDVEPALDRCVAESASPARLAAWLQLAEAGGGAVRMHGRLVQLCQHTAPEVRRGATRVLGGSVHPEAVTVVADRLNDADASVRAEGAHALGGMIGSADAGERGEGEEVISRLASALTDRSWEVRFHAGLALARIGQPGRLALRGAREHQDRYAREMARMVSGLPDGSLAELAVRW